MSKKNIGARLKEVRRALNLTQHQLAEILGVSRFAVIKWEKGERDIPTEVYEALATKFGVNINWLLTGKGEPFITSQREVLKKKTTLVS